MEELLLELEAIEKKREEILFQIYVIEKYDLDKNCKIL